MHKIKNNLFIKFYFRNSTFHSNRYLSQMNLGYTLQCLLIFCEFSAKIHFYICDLCCYPRKIFSVVGTACLAFSSFFQFLLLLEFKIRWKGDLRVLCGKRVSASVNITGFRISIFYFPGWREADKVPHRLPLTFFILFCLLMFKHYFYGLFNRST